MKSRPTLIASVLFFALLAAGPVNLAPGLNEMRVGIDALGDAWQLAFWNPGQRAGMISSHNEQDLNADMMMFKGLYLGNPVLAMIDGPGVILRIWSAGPTGKLLFYFDGETKPLSCDFLKYMEGGCLTEKAFAVGRWANYTPIPFKKSVIVTAAGFKLEGAYWHVSYMTYKDDDGIRTITKKWDDKQKDALTAAARFWKSNGAEPGRDPGGEPFVVVRTLDVPAGGSAELKLDGAGLVTRITIADACRPDDQLSDVTLRIYHDGETEPAVDSPVDAFFGNLFDARAKSEKGPYDTMMVSATGAGYESRWPMPFAAGMRLALAGASARQVKVTIEYRKAAELPKNAMRFHAVFKSVDYPDNLKKEDVYGLSYRVPQDKNYVVLKRNGRGYYAGCFLYVISIGQDWWGEGDEMIWVDGEDEARIRGTGTEDEFNWSYGFKENRSPVSGALLAARRGKKVAPDAIGYNTLYRFRQADFVPFKDKIKVTFERLGSTTFLLPRYPGSPVNVSTERGDDYRSVAFWYELPAK